MVCMALATTVGCGGSDTGSYGYEGDPGPVHVHALEADSYLRYLLATHTGVYAVDPSTTPGKWRSSNKFDATAIVRLQDGTLLASGHPEVGKAPQAERSGGPSSLLGVMRSRDEARTWREIALGRERFFSQMRAAGNLVYGYDPTAGEMMVSADSGKTWRTAGRPPRDLQSFAVDQLDSRRILVVTPQGTWLSRDGGRRWQHTSELVGPVSSFPDGFVLAGARHTYESGGGHKWKQIGPATPERLVTLTREPDGFVVGATQRGESIYRWSGASWIVVAHAE